MQFPTVLLKQVIIIIIIIIHEFRCDASLETKLQGRYHVLGGKCHKLISKKPKKELDGRCDGQCINKLNIARSSDSYFDGYLYVYIKQPQQLHVDLGLFVFHNLTYYFASINLQALNSSSRTCLLDSMDFSLYF